MPLIGFVRSFGHEIHQEGHTHKYLWRGGFSKCHSEGAIVDFVKEQLATKETNVCVFLMQCDGIDDVPYSEATARRLTYNPSIYEEKRLPGENNLILLTLCTRNVFHPKFLLLPLDDKSFKMGVYEHVSAKVTRIPWEQRIPRAYWRGISSGEPGDNVRTRAILRLHKNPHSNARLLVPFENDNKTGPLADTTNLDLYDIWRRPMQDFVNHKYNFIIDGACIASSLQWAFASGSVPILITHPGNDWWFKRYLEPMKHYVPVAYDLSDLEERLEWLVTHDEEAQAIAENAVAFSQYYLSAGFQQYHLAKEIDIVINAPYSV
jgi:hypothetical protein